MLVRILKTNNPPWFWRVPKSIFGLGTRQNHWKTECFRGLPALRSTASPLLREKWPGCREWYCFLYNFVGSVYTHRSYNSKVHFSDRQYPSPRRQANTTCTFMAEAVCPPSNVRMCRLCTPASCRYPGSCTSGMQHQGLHPST